MRVFLDVETTAITNLLPDRIFLIVCKDDKQITYFKEDELDKFGSYITKLMTTILDSEQEQFVKDLALSELKKLNRKGMILGETTVVLSVAILFFAALLDVGI